MTRDTDDGRGAPGDGSDAPVADPGASERLRADGGSEERSSSNRSRGQGPREEAVDEVALDPWGSSTVDDYRKLFEEFGTSPMTSSNASMPNSSNSFR